MSENHLLLQIEVYLREDQYINKTNEQAITNWRPCAQLNCSSQNMQFTNMCHVTSRNKPQYTVHPATKHILMICIRRSRTLTIQVFFPLGNDYSGPEVLFWLAGCPRKVRDLEYIIVREGFIAVENWMARCSRTSGLISPQTRTFEAKNCQAVSADALFCFLNIFVENERTNAE